MTAIILQFRDYQRTKFVWPDETTPAAKDAAAPAVVILPGFSLDDSKPLDLKPLERP